MLAKSNRWTFVLSIILLAGFVIVMMSMPDPVSAAQPIKTVSNSCFSCHEDLYYLYDTGNYYCVTEQKDRCVNCHAGNPATLNKDKSHAGLIAQPLQDGDAKCQECHGQETQEHIAKLPSFKERQPVAAVAYKPNTATELGFQETPEISPSRYTGKLPWLIGGIAVFGVWLALFLSSPKNP